MSGETFSHLLPPLLISLLLVAAQETPIRYCKLFDVKNYGAVADGETDDAKAFENAWKDVCSWRGRAKLLVPEGRYLVGPLVFGGPCKGPEVVVHVRGHVLAPVDLKAYTAAEWISFRYVDGLLVTGRGKFDGQGPSVWPLNDCNKSEYCKRLPWSLNFSFVRNAKIQRITSINSKNVHMQIFACKNLKLDSIRLIAPGDSPNTDGIHLGNQATSRSPAPLSAPATIASRLDREPRTSQSPTCYAAPATGSASAASAAAETRAMSPGSPSGTAPSSGLRTASGSRRGPNLRPRPPRTTSLSRT
ncbi:hypothetical protein HPP92_021930 [Vanilla planifolia]|uniref:Polygalacturonase n=1 Tax=Vanilla planifolia TaxID=51239 RepID=A0A835UHK3_VANPL|nr:hypothetical protein HPP92_021930 [Vanilla planifolia]